MCAPGFSLLLAPLVVAGGTQAIFALTPLAGALLVWLTFIAARSLGGSVAGAMAAVLVATSPAVLYQVVQPMNDVATAALWMGVFVALQARRWALAGAFCGLALLVRPNLLPLGVVAGLFVLVTELTPGPPSLTPAMQRIRRLAVFASAALPGVLLVLWLNARLYGSPFRSGYGELGFLFSFAVLPTNAARYARWLMETQTPFPLLALAAPLVCGREKRPAVVLALALIASTSLTYFLYRPFEDWSYLRFLLPAIALMVVLASAVTVKLLMKVSPRVAPLGALAVTTVLALFCVRTADDRFAFRMQAFEQRYRSAGLVVRDRLPSEAVVLSVWDSGAVRFHGRREALVWEGLEPSWLDPGLEWLIQHGRAPYIMVESWEEAGFRSRFGGHSPVGSLDWPPKFEVDRVVRIYDPEDRAKYARGDRVMTEYLWPLRRPATRGR